MERRLSIKKAVAGLILITMLLSCSTTQPTKRIPETLPRPKNHSSSLVIGYFIIDFPEGYSFGPVSFAAHTIFSDGVTLYFRNVTQKYDFSVGVQSNGFYYFLCNGTDHYLLKGFGYTRRIDKISVSITGAINIDISSTPASLIYLGHSSFKFSNSGTGRQVHTLEADWNRISMVKHFYSICREPNCPWMAYRVVENHFEVMDEYYGAIMYYPAMVGAPQSNEALPPLPPLHIDPHYRPFGMLNPY